MRGGEGDRLDNTVLSYLRGRPQRGALGDSLSPSVGHPQIYKHRRDIRTIVHSSVVQFNRIQVCWVPFEDVRRYVA